MSRIALFPGSFDPFTVGHERLVRRFLPLFDKVVVAVGSNTEKQYMFTVEQRAERIRQCFADTLQVEVCVYSDMTIDCCHRVGAQWILRGVRNEKDMLYEQTVAAVNHKIDPTIETLLMLAEPDMVDVSSTLERERLAHQK